MLKNLVGLNMFTIVHAIILIVVLAAMIMVLISIKELSNVEEYDNEKETKTLIKEVEDDDEVITHNSIFRTLVDVDNKTLKEK